MTTGLSLERRAALIEQVQANVLDRRGLTPCDLAVFRSLLLDFHNGRTGRCDPGYRAIAKLARVGLGTVVACIRRLRAAGFLSTKRRLVYAAGRWLRWTNCYVFHRPRSGSAAEPLKIVKKKAQEGQQPRSVAQQLAAIAKWVAEEALSGRRTAAGDPPGPDSWAPGQPRGTLSTAGAAEG